MWANHSDDVWVVGDEGEFGYGVALHWDGAKWTKHRSSFGGARGDVWSPGGNRAWFASLRQFLSDGGAKEEGFVERWDGESFEKVLTIPGGNYGNIRGAGSDVFYLDRHGMNPVVAHTTLKGDAWTQESVKMPLAFALWAEGGHDLFVVGLQGAIRRRTCP